MSRGGLKQELDTHINIGMTTKSAARFSRGIERAGHAAAGTKVTLPIVDADIRGRFAILL
jgi:hypothetical protein